MAGLDPAGVGGDRLLAGIVGTEPIVAAAHAAQVKMMAEFTRSSPATPQEPFGEFVADEIAAELSVTGTAARNRVGQAVVMTTRTPAVLHALESGVLDLYRARVITEGVCGLDDATATQIADYVVDRAEGRNASQIRALIRRAVAQIDPEGARHRHDHARVDRRVVVAPREDGMAELVAFLPADQATAVYRRVDALARGSRIPGDQQGVDARRADVVVNLLLDRRDPGVTAEPDSRLRPLVHVTVAATTLAGADDKPGTLDGYGPIGAAYARKIAADPSGVWKRLVTDPADGTLVEHSRRTYRPPAALDDVVRARDVKCRFPGCPTLRPTHGPGSHHPMAKRTHHRRKPRRAVPPPSPPESAP